MVERIINSLHSIRVIYATSESSATHGVRYSLPRLVSDLADLRERSQSDQPIRAVDRRKPYPKR